MGKIKDPVNFSTAFGLDRSNVTDAGVVDVILNADTNVIVHSPPGYRAGKVQPYGS